MDKDVRYIYIYIHTHTHTHTYIIFHCIYMYTQRGILKKYIKNEIMPFATTYIDLEIITLSEVSQEEKDKYMALLIYGV